MKRELNLDEKYEKLKDDIQFLDEFQKDWNFFCNLSTMIPFNRERNDIDQSFRVNSETSFTLLQVAIVKNYGRLMRIYFNTKILPNLSFISTTESDLLKAGSEIYKFATEASIYDKTKYLSAYETRRIQLAGITFIAALKGLIQAQTKFKKIAIWSLYASPILFALSQFIEVIRKILIWK
jgi:hypothetical protein